LPSGLSEAIEGQSEDDSQTVISSESQRLAMSLNSGEGLAPQSPNAALPVPRSTVPRPNSRFGPFMLFELIGQGGMGMVFRAKHVELDKDCAVKFLATQDNVVDEALVRFTAEAKTFAQLDQHPHIVRVIDAGNIAGNYYISMELVEGMSLRNAVLKTRLDIPTIVKYVAQIADALVAVHKHGIIHRDIKPGNILVSSESAKLTDFGIAKNNPRDKGLTLTGSVLGTLAYMPPEQAEDSKGIDARADIYGLGAVLYFALSGRAPHVGASGANVIASLLTRNPERPRSLNPKIPLELERIVLKAMARDPKGRYQTAERFRDVLLDYLRNSVVREHEAEKAPKKMAPKARRAGRKQSGMPALIASMIAILGLGGITFILAKQEALKNERKATQKQGAILGPSKLLALNIVEGQWIAASRLEISGKTDQPGPLTLFIDGEEQRVKMDQAQGFVSSCIVKDGARELKIIEAGHPNSSPLALIRFYVDTIKPKIQLEDIAETTVESSVIIKGRVDEANLVSVMFNGTVIETVKSSFEEAVTLKMGKNPISISAIDKAGHKETLQFNIERAPLKPMMKLEEFPKLIGERSWTFKGTVFPKDAVLTINSTPVKVKNATFETTLALNEGKNDFVFGLKYLSQTLARTVSMTSDTLAPKITIESPTAPFRGTKPKVIFSIKSSEDTFFQLSVGQKSVASQPQAYGMAFQAEFDLADALHSYKVNARDKAGNKTELTGQFLVDSTGPEIDFNIDLKKSSKQKIALKGTLKDLSKIKSFTIGSQPISLKTDGQFLVKVYRSKLKSGLFFEAIDELGNVSKLPVQFDLVLLSDRKKWQSAGRKKDGRKLQDAEIQIVEKRLGKAYKRLGTKLYSCGGEQFRIATFIHKKTAIEFNLIPGGAFLMGRKVSPPDVLGVSPPSPVKLKPFLIGRFEVKQKEWRIYDQVVRPGEPGPELPMSRISWLDIEKWLKKAGDGLRLPSESEWEFACRASTTEKERDYFWGKNFDQSYVWSSENAGGTVHAGRRHGAAGKWNAFGLIDMLGNVWEWTADNASAGYDVIPPPKDGRPYKQAGNTGYMNRGGFWGSTGMELKHWYRDSTQGDHVSPQLGARFVVSIPDS
ncbi:MAG: protein kinase, partial [Planctomycetota bacterium]|nr:protein kinase [Planctomycetota bacterium]